jgi:hypothetical protein
MSEEKNTYNTCEGYLMPEDIDGKVEAPTEEMTEFEKAHNGENFPDPTCYKAIKRYEREQQSEWERHHKVIGCILRICELAGFSVENRIVLKDRKTGKVWE